MTRLIGVEVLRLSSRRLVRIVVPLLLALVIVIVLVDASQASKTNVEEFEAFRQERLEDYDRVAAEYEERGQEMFISRESVEADPGSTCFDSESCNASGPPQPYILRERLPNFGKAVAVICVR